jgi:hypothetical protein
MFGEVSLTNKVEMKLTVPVSGITTGTPELASLFEAVITTVFGRRLGTDETGTAVPQSVPTQIELQGDIRPSSSFNILFESGTTGVNATDLLGDIDYLLMEDDSLVVFDNDGSADYVAPDLKAVTFITTTNLAVGYPIVGVTIPYGTTISSIDVASSGALHNNGTITLSHAATGRTENERFFVTIPYTTEYSIGNTLLGETEIRGTTNHVAGTLKRGYHVGHKTPLTIDIESITRIGTVATVETKGPHGVEVGELVQLTGVTTAGYNGTFETISGQLTLTGTTTSGSKSITNITTLNINALTHYSITGTGIPANVTRINSITLAGSSNNGTIELTHAATASGSVTLTVTPISEDQFKITVGSGLTSPAVLSTVASVLLVSPFDNSTRDLTMRSHKDISIYPIYGGWSANQRDRYGLGPRQSNAIKYMWATPPITDTTPVRMDGGIGYAYPNIIRRGSPETGTDNVGAGSAGVYDTTMEYTNIQIGTHESDVHMRISDFADVRISDLITDSRTILESAGTTFDGRQFETLEYLIMEDGSPIVSEGEFTIPEESRKIWNVPPPSYIRLITS